MYELEKVGETSHFFHCPARVGLVEVGDNKVCLIDAGSDKDAGRRIRKVLDEKGYELAAIYNTHSHADHTGGNKYLQDQTGCRIFAPDVEDDIIRHPFMEPVTLYAGDPPDRMRNKFLMSKDSRVERLTKESLPKGWEIIPLPGHSFNMVGYRTSDDVVYLADVLSSEETLEKYGVPFLFDVEASLKTLDKVEDMEASYFVPAHADPCREVAALARLNREKIYEVAEDIEEILEEKLAFDDLLQKVFRRSRMEMNFTQHALIGSTVRSYLSWLEREGRIEAIIEEEKLYWRKK